MSDTVRNARHRTEDKLPSYVAEFDSATTPLQTLATFLHGETYRGRTGSPFGNLALSGASKLPVNWREALYTWMGALDAAPARDIGGVRAEDISRWAVNSYPQRNYPAAMIGSSNGAAIHLCAALGIPWLPQNTLLPVRRNLPPDEPKKDLEWGKEHARRLLRHNPELRVYQMADPNQDRLMLQKMAYFRVKRLRLGQEYERFLRSNLQPGATLFLLECNFYWPATRVSAGHIFQFGGYGGIDPQEYLTGSDRIREYLRRRGSPLREWDPPEPDGEHPESEWGFDPELRADVERFAKQNGYQVRRIRFPEPLDLSPFVADLYRWWYRRLGRPADRLLAESFILLNPYLTFTTGSVPYWATFNSGRDADALADYLDGTEAYDEIFATLFENSVEAVGLAPIERWRSVLQKARHNSRFVGIDERKYPRDLAAFYRHYTELEKLDAGLSVPEPLRLKELDDFVAEYGDRYPVRFTGEDSRDGPTS